MHDVLYTTPHQSHKTGPPGWAGVRRKLLDFMVQGKINRGRHADHPAGRHSIQTNQCPPPPSPHFLQAGCPSCHPTNTPTVSKHWRHDVLYRPTIFCPTYGCGLCIETYYYYYYTNFNNYFSAKFRNKLHRKPELNRTSVASM